MNRGIEAAHGQREIDGIHVVQEMTSESDARRCHGAYAENSVEVRAASHGKKGLSNPMTGPFGRLIAPADGRDMRGTRHTNEDEAVVPPPPALGAADLFLAALERLARDINKNSGSYLLLLLIIYFFVTAAYALKPFWYDELYTFYIAKLPSIAAAWAAVRAGADLNPPLLYAAVHISQKIVGANELGTRLPSIVALAGVFVALYAVLQKRVGKVYAMCGAMVPLITAAYWYAAEARPTALVLAGAALAMVSWQKATESESRPGWLLGITAGLGIALLSHCFAVVLAIPFAAGETTRSVRLKRFDWRVWIAFAASTPALLFYPALFRSSSGAAGHIFPPVASRFATFYKDLAGAGLSWIALALLIFIWLGSRTGREPRPWTMPSWESAWVIGALLIPVVLIAFTMASGRVFATRYGLVAVLGLAVLLGHAFHRAANGDERAGAAVLLLFAGAFLGSFLVQVFQASHARASETGVVEPGVPRIEIRGHPLLSRLPTGNAPIVVATGTWFLEVDHYAPPEIARRLYSLSDSAAAIRYTGSTLYDRGYAGLLRWFPIRGHFADYADFTARHESFFVYSAIDDPLTWLLKQLAAEKMPLRLIGSRDNALLLEVRVPHPDLRSSEDPAHTRN